MTNLTEYSWYYCKMNDGDIRMLERGADYFLDGDVPLLNNEVESVLAEVPSYELWKAVHEQWKVLLDENTKLKELLKECEHIMCIEKDFASCHFEKDKLCKLLTKISQVLGEE